MKRVGIFRLLYPAPSETFIGAQASGLSAYSPYFLMGRRLKEIPFSGQAVSDRDFCSMKQMAYLLSRSPALFGNVPPLDLIHAHFGAGGVYALPLAEKLAVPLIVTFHGYDATSSIPKSPVGLRYWLGERELKQKAALFIAVSGFIAERLKERGYPADRIVRHYIGIDTQRFHPKDGVPSERYICCVGRHTPKKGIDTLLRAFARVADKHPEVRLLQVGAGPETERLQRLASSLNLGARVAFLGACPSDQVLSLVQGAEVFALASQRAPNGDCEGLPISILEAAACAVPVLSTRHAGIPEAISDGENGILVDERNDEALAVALDRLLSDRALARRMGLKGRERMLESFDVRKQGQALEALYDQVLK